MSGIGSEFGVPESEIFVAVPSYNHAPFIEQCLRSIITQTLQPKKLLVIDDGSADNSLAVIERVLKDCPFSAELIVRENRGLCRTLNQALEISDGKYFAYISSDDFWFPEFLEARANLLSKRPAAVLAYGHAILVDDSGNTFDSTSANKINGEDYPDGDARNMLLKGIGPVSSSIMYRQSAIETLGWNEGARLEDYEMYLRLMSQGDFAFDDRILSAWRRHSKNTSGDRLLMLNEILAAQERNFDLLDLTRKELAAVQTRTRFLYARLELQHGNKAGAFQLARRSWRGATSTTDLLKFYFRMLVPMSVVRFRRQVRDTKKNELGFGHG